MPLVVGNGVAHREAVSKLSEYYRQNFTSSTKSRILNATIFFLVTELRKLVTISRRRFSTPETVFYLWYAYECTLIRSFAFFVERRRVSGCQTITLWTTALRFWAMTKITTRSSCMRMPLLAILSCRVRPSKGVTGKSKEDNKRRKKCFLLFFFFRLKPFTRI